MGDARSGDDALRSRSSGDESGDECGASEHDDDSPAGRVARVPVVELPELEPPLFASGEYGMHVSGVTVSCGEIVSPSSRSRRPVSAGASARRRRQPQ